MTTTPNKPTATLPTSADIVATVKACLWPGGGHITENDRARIERIGNQLAGWIDAAMPGYELMAAKAKLHDAEQAQFNERDHRDACKRKLNELRQQVDDMQAKVAACDELLIERIGVTNAAREILKRLEANQ